MEVAGTLKPLLILLEKVLQIPENPSRMIETPDRIFLVCGHLSISELIASTPLFRAIKEKFPATHITLLVRTRHKDAVAYNTNIDTLLDINWKTIFFPFGLINTLKKRYEVAIVPVIESFSLFGSLAARLSNSKTRIGAASLNGKGNPFNFCFDRRISLDWKKYHDFHITEKSLEIIRPFGIETKDMRFQIGFSEKNMRTALEFVSKFANMTDTLIIGLNLDSINPSCLWSLDNFASLIEKINSKYNAKFYLIDNMKKTKLSGIVMKKLSFEISLFDDKIVTNLSALISISDLFITNDSEVMLIAGSTETSMIGIFGQSNPYSRLPFGEKKYFLRKSDLIDDITVDDVFSLCSEVLELNKKLKRN